MNCGCLHLILPGPLDVPPGPLLSCTDWVELFDRGGRRRHEEVDLAIVDYGQIANVDAIWKTDRWEQASREFDLFSRTARDELDATLGGSIREGSLPPETGFEPASTPCARCGQDTGIGADPNSGASCGYCGHVPAEE